MTKETTELNKKMKTIKDPQHRRKILLAALREETLRGLSEAISRQEMAEKKEQEKPQRYMTAVGY